MLHPDFKVSTPQLMKDVLAFVDGDFNDPLFRRTLAGILRFLAEQVMEARTNCGSRILDASDFRAWLKELAEEAEK